MPKEIMADPRMLCSLKASITHQRPLDHVVETRLPVPIYASDIRSIAKNPPRHRRADASKGA
jgi:hypothetical protein